MPIKANQCWGCLLLRKRLLNSLALLHHQTTAATLHSAAGFCDSGNEIPCFKGAACSNAFHKAHPAESTCVDSPILHTQTPFGIREGRESKLTSSRSTPFSRSERLSRRHIRVHCFSNHKTGTGFANVLSKRPPFRFKFDMWHSDHHWNGRGLNGRRSPRDIAPGKAPALNFGTRLRW